MDCPGKRNTRENFRTEIETYGFGHGKRRSSLIRYFSVSKMVSLIASELICQLKPEAAHTPTRNPPSPSALPRTFRLPR